MKLYALFEHRTHHSSGPVQIQKVGAYYRLCEGGLGGTPPGNFKVLHALKCIMGGFWGSFSRVCRAAERIVGPQGKYKKWGPYYRLCEGGLGGCPWEILGFYMLWSVFWGLLRLLFVHAYSTYIPGSYRLRLAVSIEKYDIWDPSQQLFSSHVR